MTPFSQPFGYLLTPGVSAGIVIWESHLFIHTWPEDSAARIIVDSCKSFRTQDVVEFITETIGASEVDIDEL